MTGKHVWNMGRLRDDLNIVSTETVKTSIRDQFKVTQEDNKLIQDCKTMCLLFTDCLILSIAWDRRLINGLLVMEVLLRGGIGVSRRTTDMLLYSRPSHGNIDAHSSIRTERTEKNPFKLKWRRMLHAVCWFDLRLAQNQGSDILQTINNAITLYNLMPADRLVNVVKSNLND